MEDILYYGPVRYYFDTIPNDIITVILLNIEDTYDFVQIFRSSISSLEVVLQSGTFWQSMIGILFPKGGSKYLNPYLTTFKEKYNFYDETLIKYKKLESVSKLLSDVVLEALGN